MDNSGYGGQLMEMQQTRWAVDKIQKESFIFDMCFSYGDKDEEILQSCQGTVIRALEEERTYMTAEIKWDKECLRERDREISQDKLMRSK